MAIAITPLSSHIGQFNRARAERHFVFGALVRRYGFNQSSVIVPVPHDNEVAPGCRDEP